MSDRCDGFVMGVNREGREGNGLNYEESTLVYMPYGEVLELVYQSGQVHVLDVVVAEVSDQRA